jgi:hypothetical protein
MFDILKYSLQKGLVTQKIARAADFSSPEMEALGGELKAEIRKRFGRSLHLREVDTGSCGACESELIALSNPLYDIQRFGIDFVASPARGRARGDGSRFEEYGVGAEEDVRCHARSEIRSDGR